MSDQRFMVNGQVDPEKIQTRREFADALTFVRERAGRTVRDVAKVTNVPASTIGGYFAGRHLPPLSQPQLLPEILSCCAVADDIVRKWALALARVRRSPGPRPATAPIPYRGLERFETDNADWFFGREDLTRLLLERLQETAASGGPMVVVGPSGSGKSSVLRAGLIPAVRRGALPDSDGWPVVLMTPGADPMLSLAQALIGEAGEEPHEIADLLRSEPSKVRDAVETAAGGEGTPASNTGGRLPVVLVVDQLEEVFAPGVPDQERRTFLEALTLAAARDNGAEAQPGQADAGSTRRAVSALVVLGLRADFYTHALREPSLAPALQRGQVIVPPMTQAEVRRAIVDPAMRANVDLEDGLVELLLSEMAPPANIGSAGAAHDPGALPLLSHALWATWDRGQRRRLTVDGYREIGGIRGAVARTADEVYDALPPSHQRLARQFFLRLVQVAEDVPDTRRRVPHHELPLQSGDAQEVLDRFIERRLITADTEWVEITHEALLVAWPRLRTWIDNDRAGLRIHRQLTAAAEAWRDSGDDPNALYRGGRLVLAVEWAANTRHIDLNPLEQRFLTASAEHEQAQMQLERRRTQRLKQLLAAATSLLVVAGGLAAYAFQQRAEANEQRDLAVSRQIAITANQLRATDPALAMQLSLAGYQAAKTPEARASLLDSLAGPSATRVVGPPGVMQSVAFTDDGHLMAGGGSDAKVRLWSLDDRFNPEPTDVELSGHTDTIFSVAFSPDGRTLASGSGDKTVRLWNVADPSHSTPYGEPLMRADSTVYSVAFSPDGRTLAAGSADNAVRLWDVTDPTHPVQLVSPLAAATKAIHSVAFSGNGRLLAASSADGSVHLWNVANPARPERVGAPITGPTRTVFTVAFSPDEQTLAAGAADGTVWLWDLRVPAKPAPGGRLTGPTSWVNSIAFSPGGRTIAAASSDGKVWIWQLGRIEPLASLPHPGPVTSVTFPRDESMVATGAADGIARIWQVPGPVLEGPTDDIFTASFASHSPRLAVTSTDNSATVWDTTDPRQPKMIGAPIAEASGSDRASGAAALSPDARTLAVGAVDGSIQLWNVADPSAPTPFAQRLLGPQGNIEGITFDPAGRVLAAGSDDHRVWLWDVANPQQPIPLGQPLSGHANYAYGPAFTPDGRVIAAGGADNTVRLWNISDPTAPQVPTPPLTEHTNYVFATAFSPDGKILATGGADNTVRLWDVTNANRPEPIGEPLTGPNNYVYSLAFNPSGNVLAAGSGDGRVWLWNIEDPARPAHLAALARYGGPVFVVAFDPQRGTLAAGGDQGNVLLWNIDTDQAAAYICATMGERITAAEWEKYVPDVQYSPPC